MFRNQWHQIQFVVFAQNFVDDRFAGLQVDEVDHFPDNLRNFQRRPQNVDPEEPTETNPDSSAAACGPLIPPPQHTSRQAFIMKELSWNNTLESEQIQHCQQFSWATKVEKTLAKDVRVLHLEEKASWTLDGP